MARSSHFPVISPPRQYPSIPWNIINFIGVPLLLVRVADVTDAEAVNSPVTRGSFSPVSKRTLKKCTRSNPLAHMHTHSVAFSGAKFRIWWRWPTCLTNDTIWWAFFSLFTPHIPTITSKYFLVLLGIYPLLLPFCDQVLPLWMNIDRRPHHTKHNGNPNRRQGHGAVPCGGITRRYQPLGGL